MAPITESSDRLLEGVASEKAPEPRARRVREGQRQSPFAEGDACPVSDQTQTGRRGPAEVADHC